MQQNMSVATFFGGEHIDLWIVFSVHGHAVTHAAAAALKGSREKYLV